MSAFLGPSAWGSVKFMELLEIAARVGDNARSVLRMIRVSVDDARPLPALPQPDRIG